MMTRVSLGEAQARLAELIHRLSPGDEVVITENDEPVAKIVAPPTPTATRELGALRGTVLFMADDFDAPLDDFQEYMQ